MMQEICAHDAKAKLMPARGQIKSLPLLCSYQRLLFNDEEEHLWSTKEGRVCPPRVCLNLDLGLRLVHFNDTRTLG